jgi:anti-anti-sigma factor
MGGVSGGEAMTPPELLHIDVHTDRPRHAVLVLRGELDHVSAGEVRRAVETLASDGREEIVLDLSALSFMDAGGVKLLYGLRDRAAGAACSIVDGSPVAARLLELLPEPCPLPRGDVRPAASAK